MVASAVLERSSCDAEPMTLPASERRGVRPRELARQLGVAPNVVYSAVYAGEFGSVWRFGRAIVIPADEVDRWLASKAA